MTERIKWIDRIFKFDFPAGIYPEMIERVRGTPAEHDDYHLARISELKKVFSRKGAKAQSLPGSR